MTAPSFVLASASPRRLALLEQIGLSPDDVLPVDIDETPHDKEAPRALAIRLARDKARAGAARAPAACVLGADTVVGLGRRILPKAMTEAEARACLELLGGRAHRVFTAICLQRPGAPAASRLVETRVEFKRLEGREIDAYIAAGEWRGKAGGYAIQGRAGKFVTALSGSYSAVVGLPLYETAALLEGAGMRAFAR
jgi:septum formation protein